MLLLVACSTGPGDLERLESTLAGADGLCADIVAEEVRYECVLAEVARGDASGCSGFDGVKGEECAFVAAEATGELALCDAAGQFAVQCRLHALRDAAPLPTLEDPDFVELVSARISDVGFEPDDAQAWEWALIAALRAQEPLDRGRCAGLTERREACEGAADSAFERRLSGVADRGMLPCSGPLPDAVQPAPDDAFDAIVAELRSAGRCSEDPRPMGGRQGAQSPEERAEATTRSKAASP